MARRTKIVATLGPATDPAPAMADLIAAGVDLVRVNFSHGSFDEHARRIKHVRAAAAKASRVIGILGDLRGPKVRIECFAAGSVMLVEGERFTLDPSLAPNAGSATAVGVAYESLPRDVRAGDTLLLNDGLIALEVSGVEGTQVHTKVVTGGELSDKKGLNKQGGGLSAGALTAKDREDIGMAAKLGVDYLAVSFVRDRNDIAEAWDLLRAAGGEGRIVAKIERREGIDNLESIIDETAAVMVARGDLGVELGYAELTGLQKHIIARARAKSRLVITATQMMESMIHAPVPTRAEVSDVANAVMDDTDAVMLSAETAVGRHPGRVVRAMAQVIEGAEKWQQSNRPELRTDGQFLRTDEAIAGAVMYTANHLDVRAIVALTESGSVALWMSRIRSDIPIYAFTRHAATKRRVTLYRGVYPVEFDVTHARPEQIYGAIFERLMRDGLATEGDLVIVTKGELSGVSGGTNSMKILKVQRNPQ
jgi:pyruvate kinase